MTNRVVILVPNWSGGIDRLFDNINQSAESGFEISLFNTHGRSLSGLSFLPFRLVYYTSAFLYTLLLPLRLLAFFVLCLFGRVDVCHANLSTGASTIRKGLFTLICRLFRIKYVIHLHGGDYRRFFRALPAPLQAFARSLYLNADRVIVLGSLWENYVVDELRVAPENVVVLPNAAPGPENLDVSARSRPPQIVFLGRLVESKGIVELIDALSDSRVSALPWTAVLAGDGEILKFGNKVDELGLSDRIDTPGWVSADAVDAVLRQSSIFVLPSHFENLPLSMLEAMAYGLCCIVTPVGSVEDVIRNDVNGIVVPVGDSVSLADALLSTLQDAELRDRLGQEARKNFLDMYDYRAYRGKLESIYQSVLSA